MIRLNSKNVIRVELKNNICLYGFMVKCDLAMNMHMKDVEIIHLSTKNSKKVKDLFVRGQNIKTVKLHTWTLSKQELFS